MTFLPLYCWLHWILPSTNEEPAAPPAVVGVAPPPAADVAVAAAAVVVAPAAVVAAAAVVAGVDAVVDSLFLSLPHAAINTPAATSAVTAARCLLLMTLPLLSKVLGRPRPWN